MCVWISRFQIWYQTIILLRDMGQQSRSGEHHSALVYLSASNTPQIRVLAGRYWWFICIVRLGDG